MILAKHAFSESEMASETIAGTPDDADESSEDTVAHVRFFRWNDRSMM